MDDFKVLSDREHVLARPQMYIGATTAEAISDIINYKYQTKIIVPALIKMFDEIINNSIDEHIRTACEYANDIHVEIHDNLDGCEITISDNGRGIPHTKIDDVPRPVLAWTALRAGSNFDDATRVGAGANGVGSSCVNIMSSSFVGKTSDSKNTMIVTCSDNMQNVKWATVKGGKHGTSVSFVPDFTRLGSISFDQDHLDVIRDRVINYAIAYPTITFRFNGEKIHFKSIKQVAKNFHNDAIAVESEKFGVIVAPAGSDEEFRFVSYMNGIRNKNGGSHIDYIVNHIVDAVRSHVKKKHKIEVLPNQVKQHLLLGIWGRGFAALKFDSQTKERITNTQSEVAEYFKDVDWEKIAKQILQTPSIIDPMISAILFKKEREEAAALAKAAKAAKKVRVANHIAATSKDVEKRILCITEGLSAIGMLIDCRASSEYIGGYPLRGKVMNVRGMKPVEIMKNKEIAELLSIIGLEFGKPAIDLNYGKIAIFTDADTDGSHILSLLLNLFSNWPMLFAEGRICRMLSPLYVCTKGKDVKWYYTKEEFDKANLKGYTVEYMKGLGSLPKQIYKDVINNPSLVTFDNDDNFKSLELAFGDDADSRKKWMSQ